ncbi:hypothetical protein [Thermomonas aquatica]|uniref:Uncharacterized protein n=1 Tax=Thermomonas aquatica TaxID=2202149 RepID=A0A5B7ZNI0_9GAMM|nr:hypothetical protein [Thermomonas aquatica]QDA56518.1 hypothetical protein FHQ07_03905 [Thermomonas aquatica]
MQEHTLLSRFKGQVSNELIRLCGNGVAAAHIDADMARATLGNEVFTSDFTQVVPHLECKVTESCTRVVERSTAHNHSIYAAVIADADNVECV